MQRIWTLLNRRTPGSYGPHGIAEIHRSDGSHARWRAWLRSLACFGLVGAILSVSLAGCGGIGPRPGGYDCNAGCLTTLTLTHSHTDATGVPDLDSARLTGAMTDLLLGQLSCDGACRASTGDIANPGMIATNFCLYQSDSGAWACGGYATDAAGTDQFYVTYSVPGKTAVGVWLGGVPSIPDKKGGWPHAIIYIFSYLGLDAIEGKWYILIQSVLPGDPLAGDLFSYTLPFTLSAFQPTHIQYIQYIRGTSGATAGVAIFTNNLYGDTMDHVSGSPTSFATKWKVLQHDGALTPTGTATNPSFAGWGLTPSSTSYGGRFVVYCCTNPLA